MLVSTRDRQDREGHNHHDKRLCDRKACRGRDKAQYP